MVNPGNTTFNSLVRKGKKSARGRKPRAARRRPARKGGLVKAMRSIAKSEALKQQETKYTTQIVLGNQYITNQLISTFVQSNTQRLNLAIPPLQLGTTYSELIGSKMTLISGYTKFHFTLNYDNTATQEIIVKLFLLTAKTVKAAQSALSGLYGADLLKLSNYQQDWKPSLADPRVLNMLPLNDNAWNGKVITFKLSKNGGGMNGDKTAGQDVGANLANHPSYHEFKWNWGSKDKVLKYDTPLNPPTTAQFQYPTNCCPLFGMCAYYPDGSPVGNDGDEMPVKVIATNHMWYKDA